MDNESEQNWAPADAYRNPAPLTPAEFRKLYENSWPDTRPQEPKLSEKPKVPVTYWGLLHEAEQVIDTVLKKNHDYGDAWQALGEVGAAARFLDKAFRIEKLANGAEALVLNEGFGDTVQDYVGYGMLIMLYLRFKGDKPE